MSTLGNANVGVAGEKQAKTAVQGFQSDLGEVLSCFRAIRRRVETAAYRLDRQFNEPAPATEAKQAVIGTPEKACLYHILAQLQEEVGRIEYILVQQEQLV